MVQRHTLETFHYIRFLKCLLSLLFSKVDLKCSSPAVGPPYYRECLAKLKENRRPLDSNRLRVGDRVSVCLDAEVLRAMSVGHGGWVDDMAEVRITI